MQPQCQRRPKARHWIWVGLGIWGLVACAPTQQRQATLSSSPGSNPIQPSPPASKAPQPPKAQSSADSYRLALDRADSARSISQSAQSAEDWKLVISRWQQAIKLLQQVPKQDPNRRYVEPKLAEFQKGLAMAQHKAKGPSLKGQLEPVISAQPRLSGDGEATTPTIGVRSFQAPIKYRRDRIPVIDVMFNGGHTFEMMVDTGASGTMITPEMASRLQFKPTGSASIMTPAGPSSTPYGFINSIRVGSHSVYNVPVTLGPIALLGHDFFGECDISFRRNIVEFANCSN